MEKWMIVYALPLEVWMDIFCFPWITRREFGKVVHRIGNHKFTEHAQFYLHEWGKRKIYGGFVFSNRMPLCLIEQPRTPLPTNIKSFDGEIRIGHFDAKTMDFLLNFQPMLTDVKMIVIESAAALKDLRTILTCLAPMLDGIRVLEGSGDLVLPMVKQCFSREQFAKLQVLKFSFSDSFSIPDAVQQERVKNLVDWLTSSPGQDNTNDGPKLCVASTIYSYNGFVFELLASIRQQFLAAKTPCTFALVMNLPPGGWRSIEFHPLGNGIGEQLRLEWTADGWQKQLVRQRANCNTELREWINENMKWKRYGCIRIRQLTIGPIDAAAQEDVPPTDEEQNDIQQQPCSSKDV